MAAAAAVVLEDLLARSWAGSVVAEGTAAAIPRATAAAVVAAAAWQESLLGSSSGDYLEAGASTAATPQTTAVVAAETVRQERLSVNWRQISSREVAKTSRNNRRTTMEVHSKTSRTTAA